MDSGITPRAKYYFTFTPKIQSVPVGETTGGYRIDLRYTSGDNEVTTNAAKYDEEWLTEKERNAFWYILTTEDQHRVERAEKVNYAIIKQLRKTSAEGSKLMDVRNAGTLEWFGIDGAIMSGGDWATVRKDGVATFDGRITLKADDSFLIDAVVSGVVDLRSKTKDTLKSNSIFNKWLTGTLSDQTIPVLLALHFEAASAGESWANDTIRNASLGFWKFERLVRGQFVAAGTMTLQATTYSPISNIALDVFEIEATRPEPDPKRSGGSK